MNRRTFLSLVPACLLLPSVARSKEPLSLEDAIRSSFSRSATPTTYCSLEVVGELKAKMHWSVDRSQVQRTIDCFKEWADLVLRNRNGTGFVLTVGKEKYSVDKNLLCTQMETK